MTLYPTLGAAYAVASDDERGPDLRRLERYNRSRHGPEADATLSEALLAPVIRPSDRLAMTLCLAIVLHAMVILGVGFVPPERPEPNLHRLDVILVQQREHNRPPNAKLLAQANLTGGGDSKEDVRPASPLAAPFPERRADIAAAPPPGVVSPLEQAVLERNRKPSRAASPEGESRKPDRIKPLAAEARKPTKMPAVPAVTQKPGPDQEEHAEPAAAAAVVPTGSELVNQSLAMASLNAEIAQRLEARAKRPRRKFISATTREYKYAAYMEAWRSKVERVGNLNYPEEARRKKLSGSLIVEVALAPDGSVSDIAIRRPSGHEELDQAAIRIVKLAAPFAPFPKDINSEIDVLHITRTWQFQGNYRLTSR